MRAQVTRTDAPERHAEHEPEYHYERRHPEESVLYRVVPTHWGEFRERIEAVGSWLKFVVRDVEGLSSMEDAFTGMVTVIQRFASALRVMTGSQIDLVGGMGA